MEEFVSIEELAKELKKKLDLIPEQNSRRTPEQVTIKKKIVTLYAFNGTGKTRLSNLISEVNESEIEDEIETENDTIKVLCYNVFLEDMFTWDNENYILRFNPNNWTIKLIVEQWLENYIISNFNDIINANGLKIEPSFDFVKWEVTFKVVSGSIAYDSDIAYNSNVTYDGFGRTENIKISKGEESMLIWSVFYTLLETAIDTLNTVETNRTTPIFNDLKYIIIDDPVSSIDDTKIITTAIKLIEAISLYQGNAVKFLITTHHALFYNVLVNSFDRMKRRRECDFESYSLSKNNNKLELKKQDDSPFSYHLSVKELIQKAIQSDSIEKYHFNLFRALLEKTSNFLGYKNWADCIVWERKQEFVRLLNLYSHSRLSDLESRELSNGDKILFQDTFNAFIQSCNWNN